MKPEHWETQNIGGWCTCITEEKELMDKRDRRKKVESWKLNVGTHAEFSTA